MIYAVIGAGPRVGTSFVMRKLHEAGLPVYWDEDFYPADEGNPLGYFETRPEHLEHLEGRILKAWPNPLINHMGIRGAVLLKRDRATQLKSIKRAMIREKYEGVEPEWFLDRSLSYVQSIGFDHRTFATEHLDDDIDEIIGYFHRMIESEAA